MSNSEEIIRNYDNECKAAINSFKKELQKFRTGRASGSLLEGLQVDYYGSKTALTHLGQITVPEPRVIMIQVYDSQAVSSVEKAIQTAGLGLNPSRDGNLIRVNVPPLTEETRKDLVKRLHKLAEDIKVSVRNHRRDANEEVKKLEKASTITKDETAKTMEKIQKQTDLSIAEVDKLLSVKEAECMEI
ncbi:MAG: ribosome recycling factor [Proteobacteria bacterium]|nr:ribosome recycling factor [Pseudomonadota bacterium]